MNLDEEKSDNNEILQFQTICSNCSADCKTNMKETKIPFFDTVIIMATVCDNCGVKSNEVKSGNGISDKGIKYTLKITDPTDLARDVLKSDVAYLEIPEIDFMMESGTLGGKFTTLEGLLQSSYDQLNSFCSFTDDVDEASLSGDAIKMKQFLDKLKSIYMGKMLNVTIILDDPTGHSYLQNIYAPDEDPNLKIEKYERNSDQNDLLGLNEMKTENYI